MFEYFNAFYNWIDDNPEQVDTTSVAVYFALLSIANRLNWKDKFSIVLTDVQEKCGIGSRTTLLKAISKLEEIGFIKTVSHSQNQYKNRVICLPINGSQVKGKRKASERQVEPSKTHHKTIKTIKDYKDLIDYKQYFQNTTLKETFVLFIENRIAQKKKPSEKAVELLVKKLRELSQSNTEKAIRIIENSIEANWQTFYPLKNDLPKENHSLSRASKTRINDL